MKAYFHAIMTNKLLTGFNKNHVAKRSKVNVSQSLLLPSLRPMKSSKACGVIVLWNIALRKWKTKVRIVKLQNFQHSCYWTRHMSTPLFIRRNGMLDARHMLSRSQNDLNFQTAFVWSGHFSRAFFLNKTQSNRSHTDLACLCWPMLARILCVTVSYV